MIFIGLSCIEISPYTYVQTAAKEPAAVSVEEQISFFTPGPNPVVDRIRKLNLMEITPSQAIGILEELKEAIDD